MDFNFNVIYHT